MGLSQRAFDQLIPSYQEAWEKSGAPLVNGVPDYGLELVGKPEQLLDEPLYSRVGPKRQLGSRILLAYTLSDGLDRLVVANVLTDRHASDAPFISTNGTAWTTRPDSGYVAERSQLIVEQGIHNISIGAPGSTNSRFATPKQIAGISLSKDAQAEQLILSDVSERYSLPSAQYAIGDSRDAMKKPGHVLYAPMYGNEIIFIDTRAPCVPDQLGFKDFSKVALWAGVESLGAVAVGGLLLRDGKVGRLFGTFDVHPRSQPISIGGIMPALMNGEAGELARRMPYDTQGHIVLYGRDILSTVNRWHEIYEAHDNILLKDVAKGSHAHLLRRFELQVERVVRARDETLTPTLSGEPDWSYVKTGKRAEQEKQAALRLVVNQ